MPRDLYQVKFVAVGGKIVYGIVDHYSDEAKAAAKRGNAIIEDAVLPVRYEEDEKLLVDIPMEMGRYDFESDTFQDCDEYRQHVQDQFKLAQEASDKAGKGLAVGKLFQLGVGDGYAHYVVVKVNKKTVKVEWRGFCADRWTDRWLGYGGTFDRQRIEQFVTSQEALDDLFGGKISD